MYLRVFFLLCSFPQPLKIHNYFNIETTGLCDYYLTCCQSLMKDVLPYLTVRILHERDVKLKLSEEIMCFR